MTPQPPPRHAVTLRSVVLGLAGVLFVCLLAPYNDLALANTSFVGNYMPVGLLLFLLIVIALNGLLSRFTPRRALGGVEMAVVLGMALASCAIPGYALMRYLPSSIIGIHLHASDHPELRDTLAGLHLPDWLFPTFASSDARSHGNDPIVRDYVGRAPRDGNTLADRWNAVPWRAWARPALGWGLLLAPLYGAVLCLSVIVRRQWVENERLAFPLATAYVSLIEPPAPGRAMNGLLRNRGFLIAFVVVFSIHFLNGMNRYWPRYVPTFPLTFNLVGVMSEPPWSHTDWLARSGTIYFSVLGMTYFVQSKIAFSLWGFYLLRQVMQIIAASSGVEVASEALSDQVFGALVATGATILWVGRGQLTIVARQMFRGARAGEPRDEYLSYTVAGWGLMSCCVGMTVWLVAAGMTVAAAIVLVAMLVLTYLVMARVVAETGLIFATVGVWFARPWLVAANLPSSIAFYTAPSSFFWTNWLNGLTIPGLRESLSVYSTQALCVADRIEARGPEHRRGFGALVPLMGLALLVGYLAAGASTLYVEYNYAATLGARPQTPLNSAALGGSEFLLRFMFKYQPGSVIPDHHNGVAHMAIGAAVTGVLSFLRLRFSWWPLHPVGYLLWQSYPLAAAWVSIFVGWLAKVAIVRFGGGSLYTRARPFFLGLVIGEAGAAAFWLAVSLMLNGFGLNYQPINLLPG